MTNGPVVPEYGEYGSTASGGLGSTQEWMQMCPAALGA